VKPVLWDTRKCIVGEGPVSTGVDHNKIYWVDIWSNRIYWRDLYSDESGEIPTSEHVSFILPRQAGGQIVGTAHGPIAMDKSGAISPLPTRIDADGVADPIPLRWNDAKVGPCGEIWMGTSAYGAESDLIGLHRLSKDGKEITRVLSHMGLSNGMDWSPDTKIFYLLDTVALTLYAFDYFDGHISEQRVALRFDSEAKQYPDGMCVDSEGCLWIAFWNGSCLRRYSPDFKFLDEIEFPVRLVSSCAFAGSDMKTLIVTSAIGDTGWHDDHKYAGMTFKIDTDVTGKEPYVFTH
jgi:sugar lactone lactonase YvrE